MPELDAKTAARFVMLMSHERSGSHYLADMLTSTGEMHSFDEVCNFNAIDPETAPASFFRFRRQAQAADPDIVLRPGIESVTRLIDGYLLHLAGLSKRPKLLIDIKYGHVHNFELGWWPSERRPFLAEYLERRNVKIVHLTRRDSLAATVSSQIADKRRVWHKKDDAKAPATDKIKIASMKAVQEALSLEREKENFFDWLSTNACFAIEYEQIAGEARNAKMARLCAFLGLPPQKEFRSSHKKVTPPMRDAVENYDDLARIARMFGSGKLRF